MSKKLKTEAWANDYPLVPLAEIEWEARSIAVAWVEGFEKIGGVEIEQKHKLASDIMNYARRQSIDTEDYFYRAIDGFKGEIKNLRDIIVIADKIIKKHHTEDDMVNYIKSRQRVGGF